MTGVKETGLPTTTLGVTGLVVTRIGLGLAALGRPAYITLGREADLGADRAELVMEQRCHDMLDAGYDAGVRYVDTARSYGRAEEFLASWLRSRHIEPHALTIGSKWGYRYTGAWNMTAAVHETKDHSLAMLRAQLPRTTALLGSHLDLYQVHSATLESGVLHDRAVLDTLAQLARSGVAVGLTVSGPRQADVVRNALALDPGLNPFSAVQASWNLLEPSVGPALAQAHARGWGVLVKEAVANGRLTGAGTAGEATGALRDVATRHGASVDQVAMAAALDQPWADVVLSGAVTPPQLESNIAALELDLTDDDRHQLGSVTEDPAAYWEQRAALPWH